MSFTFVQMVRQNYCAIFPARKGSVKGANVEIKPKTEFAAVNCAPILELEF